MFEHVTRIAQSVTRAEAIYIYGAALADLAVRCLSPRSYCCLTGAHWRDGGGGGEQGNGCGREGSGIAWFAGC